MDADRLGAAIIGLFRFSNGAAGWLLTYALHSTVWIIAAWFLTSRRVMRDAPALQHAVWTASMVAGFVTATLQLTGVITPFVPTVRVAEGARHALGAVVVDERRRVGESPAVHVATVYPAPVPTALPRQVAIVRQIVAFDTPAGAAAANSPFASRPQSATTVRTMVFATPLPVVLLLPLALISVILLARLARSRAVLRRALEQSVDASASPVGIALRHLAREAQFGRTVSVVVNDAVSAPAAVSTSQIALPHRVLAELTPLEQEGVLAHELAHLARRDTLWLRVALVIEGVAWFQPLNRLARRRMQLAAEFAADAWAVRLTQHPLGLAQTLARIADWMAAPKVHARKQPGMRSAMGADGSPLLQRVRRLTAPASPNDSGRRQNGARWSLAAAVLAIVALAASLPSVAVGVTNRGRIAGGRDVENRLIVHRTIGQDVNVRSIAVLRVAAEMSGGR